MKIIALLAALCCGCALAASTTTDFTDLWFNPNEEGWGANVVHQRDTLFITLFVYGQNRQPTWYVGSKVDLVSTANGVLTYSGTLYKTTGPYFGGPFNENEVTVQSAGAISFVATAINAATINYSADGANVTKTVSRQTFATESVAGNYAGATLAAYQNCGSRGNNPEVFAIYDVAQNNNIVTVTETAATGYRCTYSGAYVPAGRLGTITGNATCSDGLNTAFAMSEVQISAHALSMRIAAESGNCRMLGRMGGIRR